MQISWKCLNQLIDLNDISPLDIANKLTLAGFEIENIIYQNNTNDIVLDINITANRQDIRGIINIAIELSSLLERSLMLDHYTQLNFITKTLKNADNLNLFQELYMCIIKNIPIKYNNKYLTNQLTNSHLKITHSILDMIHYFNLKWGQEIHIYKLENHKSFNNQEFNFKLNKFTSHLDIYINNNILTHISHENISQHKNISTILLINYKYNNNVTNTKKFTSQQYCIHAYIDVLDNLNQLSENILIPKIIYKYSNINKSNNTIICKIDTINKMLGPNINNNKTSIKNNKIINILQKLNFHTYEKNNILYIQVPKERTQDIEHEIDIIEEIGRIYGFNNFQDNLPKFKHINKISRITSLTQKIRRVLRSSGLHEVINYSLQPKQIKTNILIINPLNKEQTNLRNNLIHNLITSKKHNINQTNYIFEAFEIGTVFLKSLQSKKNHEALHLCCILGNQKFNQLTWEDNQYSLSWFQAKGHLEEFFEKINAQISWSLQTNSHELTQNLKEYIHPKKRIYITNQHKTIGILSEINHQIHKKINSSYKIYFFEINIYELAQTIKHKPHLQHIYVPYSHYPKITRDFSIKINTKFSMEHINHTIENIQKKQKKIIESIQLINEYYNNQTIKTLCFRITYRSQQKTLTNKEVEILDNMLKTKFDDDLQSKT